jgi:ribosomal protein L7Ae-like RNA K-turn-binding protein
MVTVQEEVTYDIEIDLHDVLEELLEDEEVPLVLNFGNPDVLAEWLDVDSSIIADGCCDENFSSCEDRQITEIYRVPRGRTVIQGKVIRDEPVALEST